MAIDKNKVSLEGLKAVYDHIDEDIGELRNALSTKAEQDGYYQGMTVGDAEQLVATKYVADSEPYTYRTSGGTADIGNRAYLDKVVGGTVAWNQVVTTDATKWKNYSNSNCQYSISDGVITVEALIDGGIGYMFGTQADCGKFIPIDHVVLLSYYVNPTINLGFGSEAFGSAFSLRPLLCTAEKWTNVLQIGKIAKNSSTMLLLKPQNVSGGNSTITAGTTWQYKNVNFFDLTQMFGTAIADYIYSLEQSAPGAGVAWFRKLFPLDYYPYNPGELISVAGLQSHDMTGFNQCEPSLAFGNIDNSGEDSGSYSTYVRTVDYTRTVPGSTYCFYAGTAQQFMQLYCIEYDADKKFIARNSIISGSSLRTTGYSTFKLSNNTNYVRVFIYKNTAFNSTDDIDICINLSWSGTRNGEYTPYEKHTYPLDSTLTLRGVPKLDAQNNLYYDGDEYLPDGTVTRKYNYLEFDGSSDEGWYLQSINSNGIANFAMMGIPAYNVRQYQATSCNRFILQDTLIGNTTTEGYFLAGNTTLYIRIESGKASNAAEFRTWLASNPTTFVYMLAEPTTETADPYQPVQIVDDWGTEEFITTGIVPVGHSTRYPANLRDKLQHLPDLASADGYYMINQVGSEMSLIQFRIPQATGLADGTYTLKATVSGGTPTYTWEAD